MEAYRGPQRETIFRNVAVLIFVFDIMSPALEVRCVRSDSPFAIDRVSGLCRPILRSIASSLNF